MSEGLNEVLKVDGRPWTPMDGIKNILDKYGLTFSVRQLFVDGHPAGQELALVPRKQPE